MNTLIHFLTQFKRELLTDKVRQLLSCTSKPLANQILTDTEKYLSELEHTVPIANPLILWGFTQHSEVEARVVCLRTFDDQVWCNPELTLTSKSVNEYIHCSSFVSNIERWRWFLGMRVHVQRLNKFDMADFAASVVRDIVSGANAPDDCDLDISAENHGRLNRLRCAELKMLYNDFHHMLPHNAFVVPWHSEKGWSRYSELQVVDYLPCAVCGSEEDSGGIVHQIHLKRICLNCCAEISAVANLPGVRIFNDSTSPWNTAPIARLRERALQAHDATE